MGSVVMVIETRMGIEAEVSPAEADAVIEQFRQRPELWRIEGTWESVQSIVALVSVRTGRTCMAWLMPVRD